MLCSITTVPETCSQHMLSADKKKTQMYNTFLLHFLHVQVIASVEKHLEA